MQNQFNRFSLNNIGNNSKKSLETTKSKTKTSGILTLAFLCILVLGTMVGLTWGAFSAQATATGTITFSISGHTCQANVDNSKLSYDQKGQGDNAGKTIIKIEPVNTTYYKRPESLTVQYAPSGGVLGATSTSSSTAGGVTTITYTQSATTVCTYKYDNTNTYGTITIVNAVVMNGDLSIAGSCIGKTFSLSFYQGYGGNSQIGNSLSATYDAVAPTLSTLPTREGYAFAGYYTAQNGRGLMVYDEQGASLDVWLIAANTNLYAHWKVNQYTVYLNNGSFDAVGIPTVTVSYGSAMPTIVVPSKSGYAFAGYYASTSYNENEKYYNADGTSALGVGGYTLTAGTTLYAKWI